MGSEMCIRDRYTTGRKPSRKSGHPGGLGKDRAGPSQDDRELQKKERIGRADDANPGKGRHASDKKQK